MEKLGKFLKKYRACKGGYKFAKDLTLEQFLNTCERGDWILWLFARTNKNYLFKLTEAKALCANTVRHLMKDERSTRAVDVALKFSAGKATIEELKIAADAADAAYASAARQKNQRLTADICCKVLPLEIWNQSEF